MATDGLFADAPFVHDAPLLTHEAETLRAERDALRARVVELEAEVARLSDLCVVCREAPRVGTAIVCGACRSKS